MFHEETIIWGYLGIIFDFQVTWANPRPADMLSLSSALNAVVRPQRPYQAAAGLMADLGSVAAAQLVAMADWIQWGFRIGELMWIL